MHIQWTAHLANSPQSKETFIKDIQNSEKVLKRLDQIINEKLKEIDRIEFNVNSYKEAGWSHLQSHLNGKKAFANEIKQLLTAD